MVVLGSWELTSIAEQSVSAVEAAGDAVEGEGLAGHEDGGEEGGGDLDHFD